MTQESFGKRLAQARKNAGLTQNDVAQTLKITPQALSQWERDKTLPEFDKIAPLAILLNIDSGVLIGALNQNEIQSYMHDVSDALKLQEKTANARLTLLVAQGRAVKFAREEAGLSISDLAKDTGVRQAALVAIEAGQWGLNAKDATAIAKRLGKDPQSLLNGEISYSPNSAKTRHDAAPPTVPGDQLVGARDFPIYAAAEGGEGFMIVHTDVMEYVKRPVILEGVPDSYGVLVTGESMVPAYRPGDMALVHPRRPIERDTDVVLYDHDPRTGDAKAMIKHLVSFNDRSLKLEQFRPAKTFTEHRADWPVCHQVVGKYNGRR